MGQAALPAALLGSSAIGSIFAPEGQELSSFEGRGNTDINPVNYAQGLGQTLSSFLEMAMNEAAQPVTAQTTVAPLPSFGGGGLPFDIAVPAVDPNRLNASLRTKPGLSTEGLYHPSPRPQGPGSEPDLGGPFVPDGGGLDSGPQWMHSRPMVSSEETGTAPAQGNGWHANQTGPSPAPDLDQAEGAIALLMAQLQGADGAGAPVQRRRLQ